MYAAFWLGFKLRSILFENLDTNTVGEFVGACLVIFLMAFMYEALKYGLSRVRYHSSTLESSRPPCCPSDTTILIHKAQVSTAERFSWMAFEMSLYGVQLAVGYSLMLIVMMCNTYVFIVVLIASGLGYALFGQQQDLLRLKSSSVGPPCKACTPTNSCNMSQASTSSATERSTEMICCAQIESSDKGLAVSA